MTGLGFEGSIDLGRKESVCGEQIEQLEKLAMAHGEFWC
jgi:hypothetical protein